MTYEYETAPAPDPLVGLLDAVVAHDKFFDNGRLKALLSAMVDRIGRPGHHDVSTMDRETCERCGAIRESTDLASINGIRFCHGFADESPTCYEFAQRLGVPEVDVLVTMPAMRKRLDDLLARYAEEGPS